MKTLTKKRFYALTLLVFTFLFSFTSFSQNIWINEIKYDDLNGTDIDDTIEIAGADNINLQYYTLVLYNGSSGNLYDTISLSGVIPNEQNGFGALSFTISNGIQNGPDGFALVNSYNEVIQFLSYEGVFTANDGPAAGMTSTDIGISGSGSSSGKSIQLQGTGFAYEDFVWVEEVSRSYGSLNANQNFPKAPLYNIWINELKYDNQGTDVADTVEIAGSDGVDLQFFKLVFYNGSNGANYQTVYLNGIIPNEQNGYGTVAFTITNGIQNGPDGIALLDLQDNVIQFLSYGGVFQATDGPANGMTSEDIGISGTSSTTGMSIQLQGTGNQYSDFNWTEEVTQSYNAINPNQNFEAKTFIQDVNFEQALIKLGYDSGMVDHFVPTANINSITTLYVYERSIANLEGIDDFVSLVNLFVDDNQLTSVDISNLSALSQFRCSNNLLANLDVSNNPLLNRLRCANNQLTSIDISMHPNFLTINCEGNPITSLDFTSNPNLNQISCDNTLITSLDVSQNPNLQSLSCSDALLTELDVSLNPNITSLRCQNNQLTSLNVKNGNNTIINDFNATNNPDLTCIEVDDVSFSTTNWTLKDAIASYSTDCSQVSSLNETNFTNLVIYPNPTSKYFKLITEEEINKVELYSNLGTLVKVFTPQEKYNLNQISKGIYVLKIYGKDKSDTKFIVIN